MIVDQKFKDWDYMRLEILKSILWLSNTLEKLLELNWLKRARRNMKLEYVFLVCIKQYYFNRNICILESGHLHVPFGRRESSRRNLMWRFS